MNHKYDWVVTLFLVAMAMDVSLTWYGIEDGMGVEGNQVFAKFTERGQSIFILGVIITEGAFLLIAIGSAILVSSIYDNKNEAMHLLLATFLIIGALGHLYGSYTWIMA